MFHRAEPQMGPTVLEARTMSLRSVFALIAFAAALVPPLTIGCSSGASGGGGGADDGEEPETMLIQTTIGPAGGTLTAPGGPTVTVPDGALPDGTTVSLVSVPTSRLTNLPSAIAAEPTAFRVDVDGGDAAEPFKVALAIPTSNELAAAGTFPCVLSYNPASNAWSIPVQTAVEDGLVLADSLPGQTLATCTISDVVGAESGRQRAAKIIPFAFGQDTFSISNTTGNLVRYPRGACWGFAHFAAWHYAHHRCDLLYEKYDPAVQSEIVEEGMDAGSSWRWITAAHHVLFGSLGSDVDPSGAISLAQDLLTVGLIAAHLEIAGSPAVLSLVTQEGLTSLLAASIEGNVFEPTLNYVADILGGGNVQDINIADIGGHAVVAFGCENGTISVYDPNHPGKAGLIHYTPLAGILPYQHEHGAFTFEHVLYEFQVAEAAMEDIHERHAADAAIPEGTCADEDSEPAEGDGGEGEGEGEGEPEPPPSPTGETLTLNLGGGLTMELVGIRAGTFMMGSDEGFSNEQPVHSVTISRDFYIGRYEVTQEQWEAVMGKNPSDFQGCDICPVDNVSWEDAVAFCDTVSAGTGYPIRLPSEAEWEYACRAGTATEYSFGDDASALGDYAWYSDNSGSRTHEVGSKLPNCWSLYDMHGNVGEWCNDWYDSAYYGVSPSTDPAGPSAGVHRVIRGGPWLSDEDVLRSAARYEYWPGARGDDVGFRVAAGAEGKGGAEGEGEGQGTWHPLADGMDGGVEALTVFNGELIAGGWFDRAGGVEAHCIARWNGSTWQPLSDGLDNTVHALAVYDGRLIAGGKFTTAGGVEAKYVARWNGDAWQPLGDGLDYKVRALTVCDGELIAGKGAGGGEHHFIARWTGSTWEPLGDGEDLDHVVCALTVFNGELIAGGLFHHAGGVDARYIARWNGSTWQPLGAGMDRSETTMRGRVDGLTVYNGQLIAGGSSTAPAGRRLTASPDGTVAPGSPSATGWRQTSYGP